MIVPWSIGMATPTCWTLFTTNLAIYPSLIEARCHMKTYIPFCGAVKSPMDGSQPPPSLDITCANMIPWHIYICRCCSSEINFCLNVWTEKKENKCVWILYSAHNQKKLWIIHIFRLHNLLEFKILKAFKWYIPVRYINDFSRSEVGYNFYPTRCVFSIPEPLD